MGQKLASVIRLEIPGEPVPAARPRFARGGRVYMPKRMRAFQERIRMVAANEGIPKLRGALIVEAWFSPILRKDGVERLKPGDTDNLLKNVLDALQGGTSPAYEDDQQVVDAYAHRVKGSREGCTWVEVWVTKELTSRPHWSK